MATLSMSELATTDVARSDAFHSKPVMRKPASTRNKSGESDRVGAGARVLRVLVVDAEQDSADALLRQVRYTGHDAHAALDGFAALRVAAAWHPDVVFLILEMPLMDGCQVAKQLRSDYLCEDCLVIAFAERADDARRIRCMEAGMDLLPSQPVAQDVVETLLMLESVRVNRRRMRKAVNNLNRRT